MDELELKSIWNAYDKKIETSLRLNARIFGELQTGKVRSKLNALLSVKVTGVVIGVLWIAFLMFLIFTINIKNFWFSGSAALILIFNLIAILRYIEHILLINRLDYTESITSTQVKLAELQLSTIDTTRLLWLQLPFYATFFWNDSWVMGGDKGFWLIAFPIAVVLMLAAAWLYKNITPENIHKRWVKKFMMAGMEYQYAVSASELLQEIAEFKKDAAFLDGPQDPSGL